MKTILSFLVVSMSLFANDFMSVKPLMKSVSDKSVISGIVYAKNEQVVSTRNSGRIVDIRVQEGDLVKKGDIVVRIDPIELSTKISSAKSTLQIQESSLDSASTNLLKAKADLEIQSRLLEEAKEDLQRFKNLFDNGVLSKREFDKKMLETSIKEDKYKIAKHNLKVAQNQVDSAKSGLNMANSELANVKNQLQYSYLEAEFDGVVITKYKNEFETTMPGEPILKIVSLKKLRVEARVQESDINHIQVGDVVEIQIPSLSKFIKGVVAIKSSQGDALTHTYMVKFDVDEEGLLPGMFAKVYLVGASEKMLTLPPSSLITKAGVLGVFVKKEKILEFRPIELLYLSADMIGVKGLNQEEDVLVYPQAGYYDGMSL